MSARGVALKGAGPGSGRRPSCGSITVFPSPCSPSPPCEVCPRRRHTHCALQGDQRPSDRLYLYCSGIMASKCPKCDKTVYFGEYVVFFFNPSAARRVSHLVSSFVRFLSTDVIFLKVENCLILSEFTKHGKLHHWLEGFYFRKIVTI